MNQKHQRLTKLFLSVFVCFQLITVFVCPNPESIIFRYFDTTLIPYANFFGFNTTWRFFSPDPNVRLFEYETFTKGADGRLHGENFRYPKEISQEKSREIYNRKMNNGMYVIARGIIDKTVGPQLCKWHPQAETIAVYMKGREFPTIEKSVYLGKHVSELGKITRDYLLDVKCNELSN